MDGGHADPVKLRRSCPLAVGGMADDRPSDLGAVEQDAQSDLPEADARQVNSSADVHSVSVRSAPQSVQPSVVHGHESDHRGVDLRQISVVEVPLGQLVRQIHEDVGPIVRVPLAAIS